MHQPNTITQVKPSQTKLGVKSKPTIILIVITWNKFASKPTLFSN